MWNGQLHDGLDYWARRHPDRLAAALDDEDEISYRDLARWSDGVAAHLNILGVGVGDRVAIAAANSIPWVAAAFGVAKSGGIIVPINDRFLADEAGYLIEVTEPSVIIADGPRADIMREIGVTVPVVAIDDLPRFRDGAPGDWRATRVDSSAIAMVIFTSGTTSRPKGAMMSHGSYQAKFLEMRLLDHRLGPETRALMPLGLHSSPGLPWGIMFTAMLGGSLHFTRKYNAERTLKTLTERRISFFIGAPLIYDQVSRLAEFAEADLSALGFARVGGASVSPETLTKWRERGVIVRPLYGMTEVGGGSIIATEEEALARPNSCGRGLAFTRFRIVRADGQECAAGEPGDVLLRGPGMMSGYWRDPAATAATIIDGWLHTGDVAVVDEDGYFTFVDRSKEIIKSGGFNVSPTEIEAVLASLDGIAEAAVFAVSDEKFGEVPCACVFGQGPIDPEAVFAACGTRIAGFKLPRFVIVLDGPLPRLANEKIDRRALKAAYADAAARPSMLGAKSALSE